ncbi:HPr family phosphocarrier protein [Paenibacillus nasutitermitis]|uniref:HPr domain-containing protein n=1 Tax=Paenibacillus nasutitermitis TaxID=1652958 RepID=A0A916YYA9_9BACL|nr:HPr family phosphocarrier protein [Paenibacillus nasutitermitis]GGD66825.1 hypothetical protein GCM10010911_25720 [Paenibacillus nasutitermitis]
MKSHEFVIHSEVSRDDLIAVFQKATHFTSDIQIYFDHHFIEHAVDAKSLVGVMLVPVDSGTKIRIEAKGDDEEEALSFIIQLLEACK